MNRVLIALFLSLGPVVACSSVSAQEPEDMDIAANEVQVDGYLIDVRLVKKGQKIYPQNDDLLFTQEAVDAVGGKIDCAVSLMEYRGPVRLRCGKMEKMMVASEFDDLKTGGWVYTGRSFPAGSVIYHIHEYTQAVTGEWVDIPFLDGQTVSTMVFGHKITVVGTKDYGTVISKVRTLRKGTISNACITVMPDGNYLASCTGSSENKTTTMFVSKDKGLTWQRHGTFDVEKNKIANYYNLFVHRGALYMMGVGQDKEKSDAERHTNIYICRSDDNGMTWTVPTDKTTGLLFEGLFHTATVPVTVCNGRIWRACETHGDVKKPFMISAPEDSDLLDASNWTMTNQIDNVSYYNKDGQRFSSMFEGNAVSSPDGKVYNIIRTNSSTTSAYATMIHVKDENTIEYDPLTDCINLPGGGKKFTMRYDAQSGLYWTITNPDFDGSVSHSGIYSGGMSHSLMRNRMVLLYSTDLKNWVEAKDVLYHQDPFFHGFQYCDWTFDSDDIIAVVRAGYPEKRGLPVRQHDANSFIFVRIPNFRSLQ